MKLVRFGNQNYPVHNELIDELFNSFLFNDYHAGYCGAQPATNVYETENGFRIEMMLPGFKKEDVELNFHKNTLSVKVNRKKENGQDNNGIKFIRKEFGSFDFEKKFEVPETVDSEKISASFENGILTLTLPKKEEALEKSPVEIKIV